MCNFNKIGFVENFAGATAPMGYLECNGQAVDKVRYANLYSVIGDIYNPVSHTDPNTFCVPDLQGKVSIHKSSGHVLGQSLGESEVELSVANLPSHTHGVNAVFAVGTSNAPQGNLLSNTGSFDNEYSNDAADGTMDGGMIANTGSNVPHNNMQPSLVLMAVIYTGI